ncbi:uncharacterized protein SPSK_10894 [Sporothrix schenckii 1099-18]|uniref:Siroheme synthase n=1 Tax=Sporothrix schenckii 1099-18 TaxID=1397361 RepID=A0A0F2M5I9_SPOSC|nr:uncharacterized protein SPSK_10894 [Sporothrix schenckii 1099-18]KJR84902.1 hypothetical protein SPSK_10894 [Sporothrix schenckii 1099-18]
MARIRVSEIRSSPHSHDSTESDGQLSSAEGKSLPACDLFNTTFSLHRVSPLFLGTSDLSGPHLRTLEAQLRGILTGDVVRGIEVGLNEDGEHALGNAGVLEAVTIEWVSVHETAAMSKPALQVTLQYESAQCLAILLPTLEATETANRTNTAPRQTFLHLPLLLMRMPTPLKGVISSFLSSSFDCRISTLHLNDKDVIKGWECWVRATTLPTGEYLAKDTVLTIAFSLPEIDDVAGSSDGHNTIAPPSPISQNLTGTGGRASPSLSDSASLGLRTIDIFVPDDDLRGFFEAGRQLQPALAANGTPFTQALSFYVKSHLGLDMAHSAVGVVRVACGGFVLSSNRLKIFAPPRSHADMYSGRHGDIISLILGDLVMRATE